VMALRSDHAWRQRIIRRSSPSVRVEVTTIATNAPCHPRGLSRALITPSPPSGWARPELGGCRTSCSNPSELP
jgi:hypothetical protein